MLAMKRKLINLPKGITFFLAQVVGAAVAFFAVPILTRIYDPSIYGSYLIILSFVVLVNSILVNWIQQSILRFVPGNTNQFKIIPQMILLAKLLAIIIGVTLIICSNFIPGINISFNEVLLIGLYGLITSLCGSYAALSLALGMKTRYAYFLVLQAVSPILFAVTLSHYEKSISSLIISQILGNLLPMLVVYRKYANTKINYVDVARFARYGFPLSIWVLGSQMLNNLDRFMISYYNGAADAGIYAINYNIVYSSQSLLFGSMLLSYHPTLMKLWNEKNSSYKSVINEAIGIFSIISAFTIGIFISLYKDIGVLLLGSSFRLDSPIMPIIAIANTIWGLSAYINKPFEFKSQTWKMACMCVLAAVINLTLNIIFIPHYGILAAAYTTLISFSIYVAISVFVNRDSLHTNISYLMYPILVPLSMYIVGEYIEQSFQVNGIYKVIFILIFGLFLTGVSLSLNFYNKIYEYFVEDNHSAQVL